MSAQDWCDYCHDDLEGTFYLRAVDFTDFDGHRAPLVKTWCGSCEPGDAIDPAASAALTNAITAQTEGQP